jgi:hypothetical protein
MWRRQAVDILVGFGNGPRERTPVNRERARRTRAKSDFHAASVARRFRSNRQAGTLSAVMRHACTTSIA